MYKFENHIQCVLHYGENVQSKKRNGFLSFRCEKHTLSK